MSWKAALWVFWVLAAAVLFAHLVENTDTGTASWDAARASGFAGYLLLWGSTLSGVAVYMRFRLGGHSLAIPFEAHRILSTLALSFVGVHVVALLLDPVVPFRFVDALLPFTSAYRPFQVGLGVIGLWLLVAVLASTALAARMPYSVWRRIHYLSFPCYVLALVHGIASGSDSSGQFALIVYALTAGLLAGACVLRVAGRGWSAAGESPVVA